MSPNIRNMSVAVEHLRPASKSSASDTGSDSGVGIAVEALAVASASAEPGSIEKTPATVAVEGAASIDTIIVVGDLTTDTTENAAAIRLPRAVLANDNVSDDNQTKLFAIGYTENPSGYNAAPLRVWYDDPSSLSRLAIPSDFVDQFGYRPLRFDPWIT